MAAEDRELTPDERARIAKAREKAYVLYEGKVVAHRSCGIALAETWGLPTRPYQSLRKGGITGEGTCGAIVAGELVLGELLGDPDPAGGVTDKLRRAMVWYQREIHRRMNAPPDIRCNSLTRPLGDFMGDARKTHCTHLAALVAEVAAEALVRFELPFEIGPLPEA